MTSTSRQSTILVVEDDPELRVFYRTALAIEGFNVILAEDGVDALRLLEGHLPQAIVLDMQLPRLGGRDVQREIASHADTSNIPIIVVTGTDVSDLDATAFACVLRKPVAADELLVQVRKCLRRLVL